MIIREEATLTAGSRHEQQQSIIDAIRELEQQYTEGIMSAPAYFEKKRSLIRML